MSGMPDLSKGAVDKAVLAGALRNPRWNWGSGVTAMIFLVLLAGASMLVLSERARGWIKVKLAKHLFEHRYDYRSEWLRFTETLGRSGPQAAPRSGGVPGAVRDRGRRRLDRGGLRRGAGVAQEDPSGAPRRRAAAGGLIAIRSTSSGSWDALFRPCHGVSSVSLRG